MLTERIDPQSGSSFLKGFAGQHHGWLVTLQRNGDVIAEGEPLIDVSTDGESITINGHRIDGATDLVVDRTSPGAISALRILTPSGETSIRFRTAIAPELVDGIA
jgi:hypothetical protein